MTYIDTLLRSAKTLIFDEQAMIEQANAEDATGHGFLTLALTGLTAGILAIIPAFFIQSFVLTIQKSIMISVFGLVYSVIGTIIGFIIAYSIFHMLAKIFGGIATGSQYFRVLSNVMWIKIPLSFPFLGLLLYIFMIPYFIVLNIFVLKKVHALSWTKAVIIGLSVPIIVVVLIVTFTIFYLNDIFF